MVLKTWNCFSIVYLRKKNENSTDSLSQLLNIPKSVSENAKLENDLYNRRVYVLAGHRTAGFEVTGICDHGQIGAYHKKY